MNIKITLAIIFVIISNLNIFKSDSINEFIKYMNNELDFEVNNLLLRYKKRLILLKNTIQNETDMKLIENILENICLQKRKFSNCSFYNKKNETEIINNSLASITLIEFYKQKNFKLNSFLDSILLCSLDIFNDIILTFLSESSFVRHISNNTLFKIEFTMLNGINLSFSKINNDRCIKYNDYEYNIGIHAYPRKNLLFIIEENYISLFNLEIINVIKQFLQTMSDFDNFGIIIFSETISCLTCNCNNIECNHFIEGNEINKKNILEKINENIFKNRKNSDYYKLYEYLTLNVFENYVFEKNESPNKKFPLFIIQFFYSEFYKLSNFSYNKSYINDTPFEKIFLFFEKYNKEFDDILLPIFISYYFYDNYNSKIEEIKNSYIYNITEEMGKKSQGLNKIKLAINNDYYISDFINLLISIGSFSKSKYIGDEILTSYMNFNLKNFTIYNKFDDQYEEYEFFQFSKSMFLRTSNNNIKFNDSINTFPIGIFNIYIDKISYELYYKTIFTNEIIFQILNIQEKYLYDEEKYKLLYKTKIFKSNDNFLNFSHTFNEYMSNYLLGNSSFTNFEKIFPPIPRTLENNTYEEIEKKNQNILFCIQKHKLIDIYYILIFIGILFFLLIIFLLFLYRNAFNKKSYFGGNFKFRIE